MSQKTSLLVDQVPWRKRLRNWAIKLYSLRHPPPYRRPNMEFDFDIWNGISSLHDVSGRQIGENNTGPYPYKEYIFTEEKSHSFGGSRAGLPINVTALKGVMSVWDDALQLATLLRNRYIEQRSLSDRRFNLINAYLYSKLGTALPAWLVRRKNNPLKDGELPQLETAFFTLGVGPFMVVRALMEKGDLSPLNPEPLSADAYYEIADQSGSLVTPSGKGCAGSPRLIREFLDVVMNGVYAKPLDSAEAQRAFESVGDWNDFFGYVLAASRLELLIKLNQAIMADTLIALKASNVAEPGEQAALADVTKHCYYQVVEDGDHAAIVDNMRKVLCALVDDLGDSGTLNHLRVAGLLATPLLDPDTARSEAARRIRQTNALIFPGCERDLNVLQARLGRGGWGCITESELLCRCGGSGLVSLLVTLEESAKTPAVL